MRPIHLAGLLALAVVAAGLVAPSSTGADAIRDNLRPAAREGKKSTWTVQKWGESVEAAERLAMQQAHREVLDYLAGLDPVVEWRPSEEFVGRFLVKRRSRTFEPLEVKQGDIIPNVRVDLEIDMEHEVAVEPRFGRESVLQYILRKDVQQRVQQRQVLMTKVLAVLMSLCTAVFGYIKLEEATKGYYTNWLRLAAMGLVGGAGFAVWWLS
jgi:hypothetical protein